MAKKQKPVTKVASKNKRRHGFTLVEITVVIVVIGILASIVIFSFGGWRTTSAKNEVRSDLGGVVAAMENARNYNNGYPTSLPTGFNASPNVTLTYVQRGNGVDSYCVSAQSTSVSTVVYYVDTNLGKEPHEGSCPGTITNMVKNPSAVTTAGFGGAGAAGTNGTVATGGYTGDTFLRRTFTATGTAGIYYASAMPVTVGSTYTSSAYLKVSTTSTIVPKLEWKDAGGSTISNSNGASTPLTTSWTRVSATGTAPAGAVTVTLTFYASTTWAVGAYEDIDGIMLTSGTSLYAYNDPTTSGVWSWTSVVNASTSTGVGY